MHKRVYHTWYCLRKDDGMEIRTTSKWKAWGMRLVGWKLMQRYEEGFQK